MLTFLANVAQPALTMTTITARWFRDKIDFVIEAHATLWSVKKLEHITWSSSPDTLILLQRLVTNITKFVYLSTLDIQDTKQFISISAVQKLSTKRGNP